MHRLWGLAFVGSVVLPIACFTSIPKGGHGAGLGGGEGSGGVGGSTGGGATDAGDGGAADAGDGGGACDTADAGCLGLGQMCDVFNDNGGCAAGLVCDTQNPDGDDYTCEMPTTTCDAGNCQGVGQSCNPANPNNGGCAPGLFCEASTTSTDFEYACQP